MMQKTESKMEYRYLGATGLKVSAIGYGCMDVKDQELVKKLVARAWEHGINFFDCAETYGSPRGQIETYLGAAIKALNVDREDLVITSKIFWGGDADKVNRRGLSRKHLIEGVRASLKRMQLDYLDIVFAHRYDPKTPMEEIVRSFDWLVRHGYALYWGTSEWPAQKIEEALRLCEKLRLVKPVAEQPQYSMLTRERFEKEYAGLFEEYKYGTTIWSPLAGGILTGKYNAEVPEDSRFITSAFGGHMKKYLGPENIENTRKLTAQIGEVAKDLGISSAQLALAWTLKSKDVSTAIIGSRKLEQLEDNIKALEAVSKITPEVEERLEKILNNQPEVEFDYREFKPAETRRKIATK